MCFAVQILLPRAQLTSLSCDCAPVAGPPRAPLLPTPHGRPSACARERLRTHAHSTDLPSMSSSLSSSPGVASSVSASSVASEVRLSSSRNCLAVPGVVGDPFTAFDVDEATGYLVTGTAVGSVRLWRLDHISSVVIGGAAAARRLTVDTGNSPPTTPQPASDITDEIACRVLAPSSEEGVKHIFIHDQQ